MAPKSKQVKKKKQSKSATRPASLSYGLPTRRQRSTLGALSKGEIQAVTGMVDPFSESARGARIADDDSAFSTSFQLRTTVHLTTLGTTASISVIPNPSALYRQGATYSGTVISTFGSHAPATDYAQFSANFDRYRVVSWGVRFYCTAAPTNQSGSVRAVVAAQPVQAGVDINGGLWNAVVNESVAGLDLHYVSRPTGVNWKDYIAVNAEADYDTVCAAFFGLPDASTVPTAVAAEIIMNLECVTDNQSVISAITKPGEPSNPRVMAAASHAHSNHKGLHNSASTWGWQVGNLVMGGLRYAARRMLPVVGDVIADRLMPKRYPGIMDVD